ncbi:MAG TPA: hypothetical protein VF056_04045 [Thermoleophilaceae bacterium]
MRPRAASLACLLVLALTGCGTADREDDAAAVAERFHSALEAGDGKAACAELNPETASTLERQEQKPCEEAILRLELPKGGSVADSRVYVTSAFAKLAEGGSDFLDEGPRGWRVSAAGCEPTAPSQPYDCELEN